MSDHQPMQQQEGAVLQAALKADGRSVRQVAPLAGMSEARWRQIVKGSMTANGQTVEVIAPPHTLARMAYALNLAPEQLAQAGRQDAADMLENLQNDAQRGTSVVPLPVTGAAGPDADEIELIVASNMSARQKLELIRQVLLLRAEAEQDETHADRRTPVPSDGDGGAAG